MNRLSAAYSCEQSKRFTPISCTLDDDRLLSSADEICNHNFKFLGSRLVNVGDPIDWKGLVFDPNQRDIKFPWELSRFYHAPILAEAYRRTGNGFYFVELKKQLLGWIESNPIGSHPNWMVAMEVSIRACNWALAIDILDFDLRKGERLFFDTVRFSLIEHARFILDKLEYLPIVTNHLLADFVGLTNIGFSLGDCKLGHFLVRTGVAGIEECMRRQVYADGVSFEGSIGYHRLAAELFGFTALACQFSGTTLSDVFWDTLWKMFEFANQYSTSNGRAPQIGDSDNGRLHILNSPLNDWDPSDHSHLFSLAEALWPERSLPSRRSIVFRQGGIAILRSQRLTCVIDAGSNGQDGNGGHAHNDALSFELNIDGVDFIIDPGTGYYTFDPDIRNLFRSTRMHNTVVIDGEEQNRIPPKNQGLFWLHNDVEIKNVEFRCADGRSFFAAEHTGYSRLPDPVTHRRTITLNELDEELSICDEFRFKTTHTFNWHFHLAPSVQVTRLSENSFALRSGLVEVEFFIPHAVHAAISSAPFSPSYGIITQSPTIRCTASPNFPLNYQFIIKLKK